MDYIRPSWLQKELGMDATPESRHPLATFILGLITLILLAGILCTLIGQVVSPKDGTSIDLGAERYQATQVEKNLGE